MSRKVFLAKLSSFSDHTTLALQPYSQSESDAGKEPSIYRFLGFDRNSLDCRSAMLIATSLDVSLEDITCPDGSEIYSFRAPRDAKIPFVSLTWGVLKTYTDLPCRCEKHALRTQEDVQPEEGVTKTADGEVVRYKYWRMPFAYVGDCTFNDETFTIYDDGRWTDILTLKDGGVFIGDRHYMTHNLKTSRGGPTLVSISWDHYVGPGSSRPVNESGRSDIIREQYDALNWKNRTIGCRPET
jgi:hypothetical protein